jgi:2,4-dienoyl-CoA reductase-like NADH-dependent reductase (Old Yellow Enzyme family)
MVNTIETQGVTFQTGQAKTTGLFEPLKIRELTLRNRIAVSPMCQYSAEDGVPNDWHLVHLGSRAVGGASLVIVEATAIEPRGRISPGDLGIWNDRQVECFRRITRFVHSQGAAPGIQIAHAGRKASTSAPWKNGGATLLAGDGGWGTVAPSPLPFRAGDPTPHELSVEEIRQIVEGFGAAARRAHEAGFEVVEIHAAHGYLLHQFYSPLSNRRVDEYGGSLENRTRIVREVVEAVRRNWPDQLPVFLRISTTDWTDGGWTVEDSVALAKSAKALGVDLIDCSSGGSVPHLRIPTGPGYQVPLAERVRREAEVMTAAVGMLTEAAQANEIIQTGKADLVLLARAFLRDPYWPIRAARQLGVQIQIVPQYLRGF